MILEAFGWSLSFSDFMDSVMGLIGVMALWFMQRILTKISAISDKVIEHELKHKQTENEITGIKGDINKHAQTLLNHEGRISRLEP